MTAPDSPYTLSKDVDRAPPAGAFRNDAGGASVSTSYSRQSYPHVPPFLVPGATADGRTSQLSGINQPLNTMGGFLRSINFSVPPPFAPPVMPTPVVSPYQVPHSFGYRQPSAVSVPGVSSSRPYFAGNYSEDSFAIDKIVFGGKKIDAKPQIQLHDVSHQLRNFYSSLLQFKNDVANLCLVSDRLDDKSWKDSVIGLSSQRDALKKLKQSIVVDPTFLSLVRYKIKKRQKKRMAKRKRNLSKEKPFSKYKIADLHMQQLLKVADKQKQEDNFKNEADSILFSVRQKKSEANHQIQYLTALSKLHTARIHALNVQNKQPLSDAVLGFNKVIDKLKSMWQRQLKEYLIEENGLKVMLKDLAATAEDEDCADLKKTLGQWLKLLFGTTDLQKGSYFSNFNELIEIREEWDKYVVFDERSSSKIPVGWVAPKYHNDDAWSKYIS